MFTAGVIDVMMENKIDFDGAIGVSAGVAFGCNYKSKQIGRAIRYNMKYCNDKRYSGIGSLIKTGNIYNTDFAYGEVPLKYDAFDFDTYQSNPMDFYVVCTDIETGKDYDDFFRATGYIENTQETGAVTSVLPVCDSDECCKCNKPFAKDFRFTDNRNY